MIDKLKIVIARYDELSKLMSQPDSMSNIKAFTKMAQEHRAMEDLVKNSQKYVKDYEQLKE